MEYNIVAFVNEMRRLFYNQFPYEPDIVNDLKHVRGNKNPKPLHIRDVAFMDNPIQYLGEDMIVFEIGNEIAERDYPYYHILEDAPVIRKRFQSSDKTRGSQDKVTNLGHRDYGIISFNGKSFSKEYSKNVRGARKSVVNNATRYIKDYNGNTIKINRGASSYKNIHYHYIENMILMANQQLAIDFNLRQARSKVSGLEEEYYTQELGLEPMSYDEMNFVTQVLNM